MPFKKYRKVITFLICGTITALFNILLLALIIELLGFKTPLLKNLANTIAIEISLIFTFFVYKIWVWSNAKWQLKQIIFREIPLFHLSSMVAVSLRSLLLFPIIDWLGVHYTINNLIGIGLGSILNYLACDKIIFIKIN